MTITVIHYQTTSLVTYCRRFSFMQPYVHGTLDEAQVTCKWCLKRLKDAKVTP